MSNSYTDEYYKLMRLVIHVREILKLDSHIPECSGLVSVLCWIKRRLSLLVSEYMRQDRKKKALEVRDERIRDIVLFKGSVRQSNCCNKRRGPF